MKYKIIKKELKRKDEERRMKRAFLFPGQGAQVVGMGKDIYEKYDEAKKIYDEASRISGIDVKKLCFEGPEEELNRTENTQIAILTTSLAILEVLKEKGIEADMATGLSLGEYGALIYAGMISFKDGIKLIQKRGYYMENLLPNQKFSMAAIIGLDAEKIEEVCQEIAKENKFIVVANYNCSVQTVISGQEDAIEEAMKILKAQGAKRAMKLNTSGPFHTIKLEKAKEAYEKELVNIDFHLNTKVKVIKNIDGTYYTENDNIKEILANHIISPVRFDKAIQLMEQEKVEEYLEIGPGRTLTGFVKKDNKEAKTFNINNVDSLEKYLEEQV